MKFRIEIADLVQDYNFDSKQIFIGADESCQVVLDYEGIGPRHLKLVEREGRLIVQDLASGFETFSNGKPLLPGSKVELTSFLPVEVGGIYIFAIDEVSESSTDNSFKISFGEEFQDKQSETSSQNSDALEAIQAANSQKINEQSNEVPKTSTDIDELKKQLLADSAPSSGQDNKKKYKPQLYKGNPIDTKEFKLKERNVNVGEVKKKARTKSKASAAHPVNKRPRVQRPSKRDQYIGNRINLNTMIIVFCTFMAIGVIYYKKYYLKSFEQIEAEKKQELLKKNKITVKKIESPAIAAYEEKYQLFAVMDKCTNKKVEKLCNALKTIWRKDSKEGIVEIDGTAFIGLEYTRRDNLLDLLKEIPTDKKEAENIFNNNDYQRLFSWDQFTGNGYISPLSEFKFNVDKYKNILYLIHFLTNNPLDIDPGIKKIHFFMFDYFAGELTLYDFLEIESTTVDYITREATHFNLKLRTFWNYYLSKDILSVISSVGKTQFNDFDPTFVNRFRIEDLKKVIIPYVTASKCAEGLDADFCNQIASHRQKSAYEGSLVNENKLFVIFDQNLINDKYTAEYNKNYSFEEKKILLSLLGKSNVPKNQIAEIINSRAKMTISASQFFSSVIFSELLKSNLPIKLKPYPQKEIYFIIYEPKETGLQIKFLWRINKDMVDQLAGETNLERYEEVIRFFWKANLPIITPFTTTPIEEISF